MSSKNLFKLLIRGARQIVKVVENGELVVKGEQLNNLVVLNGSNDNGLSIVVSNEGLICDIGDDDKICEKYKDADFGEIIHADGACILPGFVDAHTHPVWAGDRVNEFSMKLAGATYLDIYRNSGGIFSTVKATKHASEEHLLKLLTARLETAIRCGTTLIEAKSGYGLDIETEIKLLKVIEAAKRNLSIDISSTFLGAHAVPREMKAQEATESIIYDHLPKIKELIDDGEINVDSIDVFCEKGVFDIEQSYDILKAGRSYGFRLNFHGDELHLLCAAEMGASLKAEAISHLERVSSMGIQAMSKSGTVAIILPTTAYVLKLAPPPVREMIEAGVAIALGSDFNPNAFCISMPQVMNFACILYGMTTAEALMASTINAAAALGKSEMHGSIEIGKVADFVIINAPSWEHIIYQMSFHDTLIKYVVKRGVPIFRNTGAKQLVQN